MVRLFIILSIVVACLCLNSKALDINGKWVDVNVNSTLCLNQEGKLLLGKYNSGVGDASGWYSITGWIDQTPNAQGDIVMSWTVFWKNHNKNANSITSWNAIWMKEQNRINGIFILTEDTDKFWTGTRIGFDQYEKVASSC